MLHGRPGGVAQRWRLGHLYLFRRAWGLRMRVVECPNGIGLPEFWLWFVLGRCYLPPAACEAANPESCIDSITFHERRIAHVFYSMDYAAIIAAYCDST